MERDAKYGFAAPVAGQVPCPYCQAPISLPVEDVLAGNPIACSSCGATLQTDRESSAAALGALERWHAGTAEARERASQGATAASDRKPRSPRRRKPRP